MPLYANIKDRYCIGYFGDSQDILSDLKKARPIIEQELPGIQIYICCKDEKANIFNGEDRVILKSQLPDKIKEIAYFRELDGETVIDLLEESQIPYNPKLFIPNL